MDLDRRTFVKMAALAAATAVAERSTGGAQGALPLPVLDDHRPTDGVAWDKAPCRFCGTGCHVQVGVKA